LEVWLGIVAIMRDSDLTLTAKQIPTRHRYASP
jgi:hypothetical protein